MLRTWAWLAAIAVVGTACAAPRAATGTAGGLEHFGVRPGRPLASAVRAGDLLFLSGRMGTDAEGRLVPGGIQPETRQALENIQAELERSGSSMDRVAKCTVFLLDIGEWAQMNEVYVTFFPGNRPARTAVGVSGLPSPGARVEIECVALAGRG